MVQPGILFSCLTEYDTVLYLSPDHAPNLTILSPARISVLFVFVLPWKRTSCAMKAISERSTTILYILVPTNHQKKLEAYHLSRNISRRLQCHSDTQNGRTTQIDEHNEESVVSILAQRLFNFETTEQNESLLARK